MGCVPDQLRVTVEEWEEVERGPLQAYFVFTQQEPKQLAVLELQWPSAAAADTLTVGTLLALGR